MFVILVIATILLAVVCVASASMKFRQDPRAVDSIVETIGVPLRYLPVLAGLEIGGAAGILLGLGLAPLGVVAAGGLAGYFVGAVISHLRVGDAKGVAMPLIPLLLSVAVLVLRVATR